MDLLITEAQLNGLINEGIGGYLYYYRSPASLLDILRTNRIRASVAGFFNSESAYWETKFNKGRLFFLSTTRNKLFRFIKLGTILIPNLNDIKTLIFLSDSFG